MADDLCRVRRYGFSGAKASRPQLDALFRDAALHRFDAVLVWKLDRFGRSVRNCLDGIEKLRSQGARLVAVSESIDTDESNPTSRLMLHVLAVVAETEREMIRERVCINPPVLQLELRRCAVFTLVHASGSAPERRAAHS